MKHFTTYTFSAITPTNTEYPDHKLMAQTADIKPSKSESNKCTALGNSKTQVFEPCYLSGTSTLLIAALLTTFDRHFISSCEDK